MPNERMQALHAVRHPTCGIASDLIDNLDRLPILEELVMSLAIQLRKFSVLGELLGVVTHETLRLQRGQH
jgi:hypothetical protein